MHLYFQGLVGDRGVCLSGFVFFVLSQKTVIDSWGKHFLHWFSGFSLFLFRSGLAKYVGGSSSRYLYLVSFFNYLAICHADGKKGDGALAVSFFTNLFPGIQVGHGIYGSEGMMIPGSSNSGNKKIKLNFLSTLGTARFFSDLHCSPSISRA